MKLDIKTSTAALLREFSGPFEPILFSSLLSISSNERVRNVYGIQQF